MSRPLDVINVADPEVRRAPAMPSACESHGCSGGPEPLIPPPPSFGEVFVNGVEIDPEAIAREIQHHPAPDASSAWMEAARALAVRELLLQEGRRLRLESSPDEDDLGRTEAEDDALVTAVLDQGVQPAKASEGECRRYYEAQVARFRTPELFEAAHILIEPESQDAAHWSVAQERARSIIADVGDDPAKFGAAARSLSGCASRQQDGSLGQVRRGELVPAVQSALESLADGTTSREPVRSQFGWHVLRLHRRIPGRTLSFDAARPKIADMLEARSWSLEAARYVASLAARGEVTGVVIEGAGAA